MSSRNSNSNSDTNYSETNSNVSSSNSNSNTEVIFGKEIAVVKKPKVKFSTRRAVRRTNKTPEAVEARKSHKKRKQAPRATKNMNAQNRRILRNAAKRIILTRKEKQQRAWAYIDYLAELKSEEGADFLTEEQRDFIETELLGHLHKKKNNNSESNSNSSNSNNNSN
jgi:hypothetical protein